MTSIKINRTFENVSMKAAIVLGLVAFVAGFQHLAYFFLRMVQFLFNGELPMLGHVVIDGGGANISQLVIAIYIGVAALIFAIVWFFTKLSNEVKETEAESKNQPQEEQKNNFGRIRSKTNPA